VVHLCDPTQPHYDGEMTTLRTICYFGPASTFTEEALRTQEDLAAFTHTPVGSISDVLATVASGACDFGFVPLENAIEGTVNVTLDGLLFDHDLRIVREVILDIHLHLLAAPGQTLESIDTVMSFPHALAQCRAFLAANLPGVMTVPAESTADAARFVSEEAQYVSSTAVIASKLAGETYGLITVAEAIEDHPDNQTRFVLVARNGVPAPTGHDRTAIVCFQDADRPGSLYGILGQFAARGINLTKLESRPTKQGLGEYCFIVEFDGHLADPVIADCLTDLAATVARVKFLGSYPVAGLAAASSRAEASAARSDARQWVDGLLAERLEI